MAWATQKIQGRLENKSEQNHKAKTSESSITKIK